MGAWRVDGPALPEEQHYGCERCDADNLVDCYRYLIRRSFAELRVEYNHH